MLRQEVRSLDTPHGQVSALGVKVQYIFLGIAVTDSALLGLDFPAVDFVLQIDPPTGSFINCFHCHLAFP